MYMKSLPLVFAGALLAASLPAQAQEQITFETERNWFLEFQFGGYNPHVDAEVEGTPFADVFGQHSRLLVQASIERLIYKGFGSFGFGLNSGYTEFFGKGFIEGTDEQSADSTSLHLIPVTAFAAYRFDYPAINWGIPFVPYAKAGIGGWIFWINDAEGSTAGDGGAQGVRWGWTWSAGLALQLDFFDPRLSNEFDREYGVNNTYLFVDYTQARIDSFGKEGFNFSDNIWSGGIAFEF